MRFLNLYLGLRATESPSLSLTSLNLLRNSYDSNEAGDSQISIVAFSDFSAASLANQADLQRHCYVFFFPYRVSDQNAIVVPNEDDRNLYVVVSLAHR